MGNMSPTATENEQSSRVNYNGLHVAPPCVTFPIAWLQPVAYAAENLRSRSPNRSQFSWAGRRPISDEAGADTGEFGWRAAAIGWAISRDVIKRIESGEREVTDIELRHLAKALRVPPAVLLE